MTNKEAKLDEVNVEVIVRVHFPSSFDISCSSFIIQLITTVIVNSISHRQMTIAQRRLSHCPTPPYNFTNLYTCVPSRDRTCSRYVPLRRVDTSITSFPSPTRRGGDTGSAFPTTS